MLAPGTASLRKDSSADHIAGPGSVDVRRARSMNPLDESTIFTVGYQAATMEQFLAALLEAGADLLVDLRAVTSSRRPGFSKNQLAANLAEKGIGYVHLRGLGTPADGRAAARSGKHDRMRRIYAEHLETPAAQRDLDELANLVRSGRKVCLMCYEADPDHCHRTLVADALRDGVKPRRQSRGSENPVRGYRISPPRRSSVEVVHLRIDSGKAER